MKYIILISSPQKNQFGDEVLLVTKQRWKQTCKQNKASQGGTRTTVAWQGTSQQQSREKLIFFSFLFYYWLDWKNLILI